jgi:TatD DNase family protein
LVEEGGGVGRAVEELRGLIAGCGRVTAVGEIGVDLHYLPGKEAAQVRLFEAQLELAAELGLPASIHSRDAEEATLRVLERHVARWRGGRRPGVLHCFTGSVGFGVRAVEMGFLLGVSGIVTFRKADGVWEVVRRVALEDLVLETDTPYLAPEPHRGEPNEPAHVRLVAAEVARIKGVLVDEVARVTTATARKLLGIDGGTEGKGIQQKVTKGTKERER